MLAKHVANNKYVNFNSRYQSVTPKYHLHANHGQTALFYWKPLYT